jgi:hypothetical protein
VGRADLSKLREDLGFQIWDLRYSLDDKIDIRQIIERGAGYQPFTGCCSIVFRDSALAYIFLEKLVGKL